MKFHANVQNIHENAWKNTVGMIGVCDSWKTQKTIGKTQVFRDAKSPLENLYKTNTKIMKFHANVRNITKNAWENTVGMIGVGDP